MSWSRWGCCARACVWTEWAETLQGEVPPCLQGRGSLGTGTCRALRRDSRPQMVPCGDGNGSARGLRARPWWAELAALCGPPG